MAKKQEEPVKKQPAEPEQPPVVPGARAAPDSSGAIARARYIYTRAVTYDTRGIAIVPGTPVRRADYDDDGWTWLIQHDAIVEVKDANGKDTG